MQGGDFILYNYVAIEECVFAKKKKRQPSLRRSASLRDGGFVKYGVVKNDYVLVKGSLPGPSKRLVILRQPIRPNNKAEDIPQINYISTKSKQGV